MKSYGRASASPRLPAYLRIRASGAKPVCILLHWDRKSPPDLIQKTSSWLRDCSSSIELSLLGHPPTWSVLLWRNTIARQIGRLKLLIFCWQVSYYATSFLSTIVGTCEKAGVGSSIPSLQVKVVYLYFFLMRFEQSGERPLIWFLRSNFVCSILLGEGNGDHLDTVCNCV